MKKYIIIFSVFAFLVLVIYTLFGMYTGMREKYKVYLSNNNALLEKMIIYNAQDSVKVATIQNLTLKISEYERYRQRDAELIGQLKVDRKRIETVIAAQTKTTYDMALNVRDSIVYIDRERHTTDTVRCMEYHDRWIDFAGCVAGDSANVTVVSRDSLLLVEHIIPKRFLGFLWKYGVKERRLDAVNRNKHTEILGVELITVRK